MTAVCGASGSGKTTLLEAAIPALARRGLAVAVVKHAAHGIAADRPGKDSERLFAAGADVVVRAPAESFARHHGEVELDAALTSLAADHDLILVEGHKGTPLPKLWLASSEAEAAPEDVAEVRAVLPWGGDRMAPFLALVEEEVRRHFEERPVLGGVLVGGESSRMGRPKQSVAYRGRSLLEWVLTALAPHTERILLLGGGEGGAAAAGVERLPDVPGVVGPLAGMLSALRWAPGACWLITACDLAWTAEAAAWVLEQRRPGVWAVLPEGPRGRLQPLAGAHEPQALGLLEGLAADGRRAPRRLADHPKVDTPGIPSRLAAAFHNLNTPEDLAGP